ncbi:hypothetical protein BB559_000380 [Furculomyces boomerangus]|uniref:Cytochrome P450 n=2 Tax=Harpellales TaxID=61421 RepID=A0A2T9Z5J4_9FUNG|nr:hypothetical protein BB559_000380 [Furculomyces boomerangus]PVZ99915.1 hypothetical protein BB558_004050 [Smittium angustum]
MENANHVVQARKEKFEYLLGTKLLYEFSSASETILCVDKVQNKFDMNFSTPHLAITMSRYARALGYLASTKCLLDTIENEYYILNKSIRKHLKKNSIYVGKGVFEISDVNRFVQDIVIYSVSILHFGKLYKTDKKLQSATEFFFQDYPTFLESSSRFPSIGLALLKYGKQYEANDFIQTIVDNLDFFNLDYKSMYAHSFLKSLNMAYMNTSSKLANVIVDISLNPEMYSKLAQEQILLIKKYGNTINLMNLEEMEYLDAVIKESLRLSGTTKSHLKKTEVSYLLSNGYTIPKGSYVGFNLFAHNRNEQYFGENPSSYIPERHINSGTRLLDVSPDNFIWGVGKRMCPAREYAVAQMKLVVAILIRGFQVSQNDNVFLKHHQGYEESYNLFPRNPKVFFQPHNIMNFRSVYSDIDPFEISEEL